MGLLDSVAKAYDSLWLNIVRPERCQITDQELSPEYFPVGDGTSSIVKRIAVEVIHRQAKLKGTLFVPVAPHELTDQSDLFPRPPSESSCMVYLHSQSANRQEGRFLVDYICLHGISVMLFDFGGSGSSSEKFITLGLRESEELKEVVQTLKDKYFYDRIGLWGKSMGAASAIFYGQRSACINLMVLDSPFDKIETVITRVARQNSSMPDIVLSGVIHMIRNTIKKEVGIDVYKVNPIDVAHRVTVPACFIIGSKDDLISMDSLMGLHNAYSGEKKLIVIPNAGHADCRSENPKTIKDAVQFILKHFEGIRPSFDIGNPYALGYGVMTAQKALETKTLKNTFKKKPLQMNLIKKLSTSKNSFSSSIPQKNSKYLEREHVKGEFLGKDNLGHKSILKDDYFTANLNHETSFGRYTNENRDYNAHRTESNHVMLPNQNSILNHGTQPRCEAFENRAKSNYKSLLSMNYPVNSYRVEQPTSIKSKLDARNHMISSWSKPELPSVTKVRIECPLSSPPLNADQQSSKRLMLRSQSMDINTLDEAYGICDSQPMSPQPNRQTSRLDMFDNQRQTRKAANNFFVTSNSFAATKYLSKHSRMFIEGSCEETSNTPKDNHHNVYQRDSTQEMPSFILNFLANKLDMNDIRFRDPETTAKDSRGQPVKGFSFLNTASLPESFQKLLSRDVGRSMTQNQDYSFANMKVDDSRQETDTSLMVKQSRANVLMLKKTRCNSEQQPIDQSEGIYRPDSARQQSNRDLGRISGDRIYDNPLKYEFRQRSYSLHRG